MAKTVNPALFIGLGGTGHKVLLRVKEAVLRNYGEVPKVIKILCMDTDVRELSSSGIEIEYAKKLKDSNNEVVWQDVKENLMFDTREILPISIKNPESIMGQENIKSWISPKVTRITQSGSGAKQIRQMGRFAIFENYSTEGIRKNIEDKINEIKDLNNLKGEGYDLGNQDFEPTIHLVCSPCGGTGAGTFIDVVTIIRSIDSKIKINAYLMLPDFYSSFPMTESVVPNAYCTIKEIDHLMGMDNDDTKPWSNYKHDQPFEVDYTGQGTRFNFSQGSKFIDYIYLFDNYSAKKKHIAKDTHMHDRIARICYLLVSGTATSMDTMYSNDVDSLYPSSSRFNFKRRNYSSMGISEIILNRNFLKELKKNQISRIILNAYAYADQPLDNSALNNFIDVNLWREDSGKDSLIDKLVPRNLLKYSLDSLYPEFKKESHLELNLNVNNFLKQWDDRCLSNSRIVREEVFDDFDKKLNIEIKKYLKLKGGLSLCKQFLTFMQGSFMGMAEEMQNEVIGHKTNRDKLIKDIPLFLEAIKNEEEAFTLWGKEKNIKAASEVFVANSEKILIENWQIARKEAAKLFYDTALEVIRGAQKKISDLELFLQETSADIERESQNLRKEANRDSDFERSIHYYYKELLTEKTDDVNLEEAFLNLDFSELINFTSHVEIRHFMSVYISTTKALTDIDNLNIETLLLSLDEELQKNIIEYLDIASSESILIDSSFASTTMKPQMSKFGFLYVPDPSTTNFKTEGEFYKNLSISGGFNKDTLKISGSRNHEKITMIKVAGTFPAAAIERVKEYKVKFESSPLYHYSDVYFEKNAQDLIEGPSDETESQLYFTVGSAIGKIYIHNAALVIEVEGGEKKPLYEGTRDKTNRFVASKVFAKNKEYTAYIKNLIDRMETEKGKEFVYQELLKFYKEMTSVAVLGKVFETMDKQKDEYKNVYEEKKILKSHILERCSTVYRESDFQ